MKVPDEIRGSLKTAQRKFEKHLHKRLYVSLSEAIKRPGIFRGKECKAQGVLPPQAYLGYVEEGRFPQQRRNTPPMEIRERRSS